MKKLTAVLLGLLLLTGIFTGCSGNQTPSGNDKIKVVATIFPEYDWVRQILGDRADSAELTLLLDSGVDLHSYQPTADDIIKISSCDVFVYVGGESDSWAEKILKEEKNPDMEVVNLMELLGDNAKEEEVAEGMQGEDHGHEKEEAPEYDEHIWLSLKNAKILTRGIAEALCKADAAGAETYRANAEAYVEKLSALDSEYEAAVASSEKKTLLFADRFPFRYLTDDYNLTYYAAFLGCSAESEASFETVAFLAEKTDELNLSSVLTIEGGNRKIAETVIGSTQSKDQKILALNSMQSETLADAESGTTYLSVMEKNLEVLKEALR